MNFCWSKFREIIKVINMKLKYNYIIQLIIIILLISLTACAQNDWIRLTVRQFSQEDNWQKNGRNGGTIITTFILDRASVKGVEICASFDMDRNDGKYSCFQFAGGYGEYGACCKSKKDAEDISNEILKGKQMSFNTSACSCVFEYQPESLENELNIFSILSSIGKK